MEKSIFGKATDKKNDTRTPLGIEALVAFTIIVWFPDTPTSFLIVFNVVVIVTVEVKGGVPVGVPKATPTVGSAASV